MGFFTDTYDLAQAGQGGTDYIWFGFMVVLSPLFVPLYWLGWFAAWMVGGGPNE